MSATASVGTTTTGVLFEVATDFITLSLPGTDYRIHLVTKAPIGLAVGHRITGHIHARAKRVDVLTAGGRYFEPIYGRPRRIQGMVVATDTEHNTISVKCNAVFICELTANQSAADFQHGQLVACNIERGASFEPI